MNIDLLALTRLLPVHDCIVEERVVLRGAEVVSHVNFSQLDRVRNSRGSGFRDDGGTGALPWRWLVDAPEALDGDVAHEPALAPAMMAHLGEEDRRDGDHALGHW